MILALADRVKNINIVMGACSNDEKAGNRLFTVSFNLSFSEVASEYWLFGN
ncbi:hypothetical protein Ppb6_01583 [Photorhabdus australis subsp. thailandensis]|uniref:Uncharacterized protein n=1 Tax=Photorhabdus australis subsp. thailandensis TaxID=2805096 RepID=A0A1C0U5I2_9GAMM|nr:hypothetical protein Ppb6_01583 [Photorhabdus australis subsp. thailandensis]